MTWPTEPMVAPDHGAVPIEALSLTPDFSRWSRANLEKLATDLNNTNLQLKADLRLALDAYRANLLMLQNILAQTPTPSAPSPLHP